MTKGILRNKEDVPVNAEAASHHLDRQEVIRNTRLNAQLKSESGKGDQIRAKIAEHKNQSPEHLKWDELNLYKAEQEKCATMKIDEPKTPYEGGFNPEGEYYKEDDENIPSFQLGAPEIEPGNQFANSLNGGEILKDSSATIDDEETKLEEKPQTAEERHKHFEEMRKKHYHLKGTVLKQGYQVSDDEEDEDEDGDGDGDEDEDGDGMDNE